jgi:hypothetical protein
MDPLLEPVMEAISVPGSMSGTDIIDHLCNEIADKLSRSCDLRAVDSYARYAATVQIEMQLTDMDTTEIVERINVGTIDPCQPSQRLTIDVPTAQAEEVGERLGLEFESASLERPIDPTGFTPQKRIYVSRIRAAT